MTALASRAFGAPRDRDIWRDALAGMADLLSAAIARPAGRIALLLLLAMVLGHGSSSPPVEREVGAPPLGVAPVGAMVRLLDTAPPLLTGASARIANARIAFAASPGAPARPFVFRGTSADRAEALNCLAASVYYEAASETEAGQRAVAQVVLNRVRHPAYPDSVCAVVYEGATRATGCQFSFACDGSLSRAPDRAGWQRAARIAADAIDGQVVPAVGYATHYHADYVLPYWALRLVKSAQIGVHIFYRWPAGWGLPAAFADRHSGREADSDALVTAAAMAKGGWPALPMTDDGAVIRLVHAPTPAPPVPPPEGMPAPDAPADPLAPLADAAQAVTVPTPTRPRDEPARRLREQQEANDVLASFAAYSGLRLPPQQLAMADAPVMATARCAPAVTPGERRWAAGPGPVAARLVHSAVLEPLWAGAAGSPALARQVEMAVFVRIAALRDGEARAGALAASAAAQGATLVPILAARLRRYERERQNYPSLRSYLPLLVGGLVATPQPPCQPRPALDAEAAAAMS